MSRPLASPICITILCQMIFCGSSILPCQTVPSKPQTPATAEATHTQHLTFDVASIRESHGGGMRYIDNMPNNSFYQAIGVSPVGLILAAYNLHRFNLVEKEPGWAMRLELDLMARSDPATDEALAKLSPQDSYTEKRYMLQALLAERFHLQIHPETRMSKTYELVATPQVAKLMTPFTGDGAKTVGTCTPHFSRKGLEIATTGCPFSILLSQISQSLGTEVLDRTGLSGKFACHLMWSQPELPVQEGEERYPSLVEAVREQLGLELKETKGPITFWVVDHLERPTPN